MGYYVMNSNLSMEIVSHPLGWKVTRTHSDFESLRKYLVRKYPQTLVPSLPKYDYSKELKEKHLKKRTAYYERFLEYVLKSMTLRSSEILVIFLKETDTIQW